MDAWRARFDRDEWRLFLAAETLAQADQALRQSTHSGRPLGSAQFAAYGEAALGRRLHAAKGGRPPKREPEAVAAAASAQGSLFEIS